MRKYIIDHDAEMIPPGVYSISFKTHWHHPFTGRNGFDHHVVKVQSPTTYRKLEKWLARWTSQDTIPRGKCHIATITAMSRLDIGLTIRSGCDIME